MPASNGWRRLLPRLLAALLLAAAAPWPAAAEERVTVSAADAEAFTVSAMSVDPGGELKVTSFRFEGDVHGSELQLERFEVWHPEAVIEIKADVESPPLQLGPPATRYFRGSIAGEPGSVAVMSVREDGGVSGLAMRGNASWAIGRPGADQVPAAGNGTAPMTAAPLSSKKAQAMAADVRPPFTCANDGANFGGLGPAVAEEAAEQPASRKLKQSSVIIDQKYQATIAIETDGEYYNLFRNRDRALNYIADMIGYSDVVYSREVGVDIVLGYVRLWEGGPNSDPYRFSQDTSSLLDAFQEEWNTNMQHVPRTVAHYLSGMDNSGGVAYVGVLCDYYRTKSNNNGYGYTGSITGDFDWNEVQTSNPKSVVWDISSFMHELGHNFGSPHTHDFCGIGGNSEPVDRCYGGCRGGAQGLPKCTSTTPFFSGGAGTLMSYCHIQRGGDRNVAMTFGQGHTPPPPSPTPGGGGSVPAGAGSWSNPIVIDRLPFLGSEVSTYGSPGSGPIPCNFFIGNRPMVVYRWFSGPLNGGSLVASSCGNINSGGDAVITLLSSPNAAGGPWTCLGGDDDGCGTGSGAFQLNIRNIQPNTHYFLAVAPYSTYSPPRLRLSLTAGSGGSTTPSPSPSPAPSPSPSPAPVPSLPPSGSPGGGAIAGKGSWEDPYVITSTPFLSAESNAYQVARAPLRCWWLSAADPYPVAVYKFTANATLSGGTMLVSSCGTVRDGGDPFVTVMSSGSPTGGAFTCHGGKDNGCGGTDRGFRGALALVAGRTYYIAVSPYRSGDRPALRLNVTAVPRPNAG
ncbi:hypothetical protein COHA_004279 [Chlorella ohadii]|uniref:Peptidase M12B domain-containing protein n=1 Tax=Chlorella ohadii TaxID=2649997 RepID=A0AAD5DXG2_9CHLO|nr:hypothetical protein COHA_004279 [Chlorella ohadii]